MSKSKEATLTIKLDEAVKRSVKASAAVQGVSMNLWCEAALKARLRRDERRRGSVKPRPERR